MKNQYVVIRGSADDAEQAIQMCGEALYKEGFVSKQFGRLCIEREKEYPTGLPTKTPTAIPHAKDDGITQNSICFLKLEKAVAFRRMDDDAREIETDMIFCMAIKDPEEHLKALQNMLAFLQNTGAMEKCRSLADEQIIEFLQQQIG